MLAHVGIEKVYSFHITLSYSRDPFCCYTTSMDMGVFWDCHRRGFTHFGGVPATIVYDRTKTVVRRHGAPGKAVPLHPEAVGFAGHYDFEIDVLAAYRPTGKGRGGTQVNIVRDHVLAGRGFDSIDELDAAFGTWVPIRRGQVHRTHGEVIAIRAERDHAALRPVPSAAYLVADRQLRRVGKDCLVSFAASLYSTPARRVRPAQTVEVRATPTTVAIHSLTARPAVRTWAGRVCWRCTGAPPSAAAGSSTPATGTGCPTAADGPPPTGYPTRAGHRRSGRARRGRPVAGHPVPARAAERVMVAHRALSTYDRAAGLTPREDEHPRAAL